MEELKRRRGSSVEMLPTVFNCLGLERCKKCATIALVDLEKTLNHTFFTANSVSAQPRPDN